MRAANAGAITGKVSTPPAHNLRGSSLVHAESVKEMTHALSAIPRHVRPIRSLCEGDVTLVISPGESVVAEARWDVVCKLFYADQDRSERMP